MSTVTVIDDLLPAEQHKEILEDIGGPLFFWQYTGGTSTEWLGHDVPQFVRVAENALVPPVSDDEYYTTGLKYRAYVLNEMSEKIAGFNPVRIVRTKFNLLLEHPSSQMHPFHSIHTDVTAQIDEVAKYGIDKYKTILYYINDCDGPTHLFHEDGNVELVHPKANRVVVFDADLRHASSSPIQSDKRLVMNIVVRIE